MCEAPRHSKVERRVGFREMTDRNSLKKNEGKKVNVWKNATYLSQFFTMNPLLKTQ